MENSIWNHTVLLSTVTNKQTTKKTKRISGLPSVSEVLCPSFSLSHKPCIYNLSFHGSLKEIWSNCGHGSEEVKDYILEAVLINLTSLN